MAASFPPPKPPRRLSRRHELSRLSEPVSSTLAGPSRTFAFVAVLGAVVAGATAARLGTPAARLSAMAGVVAVVAIAVFIGIRQRRRLATLERFLATMVQSADPDGASRALRALGLLSQVKLDDSMGSRELAEVHASRALSRVSIEAITLLSRTRARWLSVAAGVVFVATAATVASGPVRLVEGLLIAGSVRGRAPLGLPYVEDLRVTVKPPDYLREKERTLVAAPGLDAPLGSALTIRGTPTLSGRALVITDLAGHEVPFADDGAGGVAVRWALAQTVTLHVAARFGETLIVQEAPITITAIPDLAPKVRLEGAPRTVKLVDEREIRVAYQAEDDHGLRQVDLVMRTGGKEERRVLSKPDGDTRTDQGGYTVRADDKFVRASYLPIEVTVEARDNDPITGPKWGKSDAFTLVPPAIGELEARRYEALVEARDVMVDLVAELSATTKPRDADVKAKLKAAREKIEEIMGRTFGPVSFSPKTRAFVSGQLTRLRERERDKTVDLKKTRETAERGAIALDRASMTIGSKDAATLGKRVSRVASDVADAFLSAARDVDKERSLQRGDAGVSVLAPSGAAIRRLAVLGNDLGEIIENGHRRIIRARTTNDFFHAELAARDLAARLARPNPSFRGGSGGGRGGDGSAGEPEPGDEAPGDDEEAFDAEQKALDELAREHGENQENVEKALRDAAKEAGGDELFEEAKRRAAELRELSGHLNQPDGDPDAPLDKGREAALRMAESLERGDFQDAKEAGRSADKSLGEASRDAADKGGDDAASVIEQARQRAAAKAAKAGQAKLAPHVKWVEDLEARLKKKLEERGQLRESSSKEGQLAEKVKELGRGSRALPENTARSLRDAEARMRDAEKALKSGDTRRGKEEQEKAQRLLEQARESGTDEPKDPSEEKGDADGKKQAKGAKSKTDGGEEGEDGKSSTHGDLPDRDAHKGPDELRKRVQEGMRRGLSPEVRDAARRYTERLLK